MLFLYSQGPFACLHMNMSFFKFLSYVNGVNKSDKLIKKATLIH